MQKWVNSLVIRIMIIAVFIVVFLPSITIEAVLVDDALSSSIDTLPASRSDFTIALTMFSVLSITIAGCGIWGRDIFTSVVSGIYSLLGLTMWEHWDKHGALLTSWEGRLYLLCLIAHLLIFVLALIGAVLFFRDLYYKRKNTDYFKRNMLH